MAYTCAYLWQLLTDYTSNTHVTLQNPLAQSLLVFLVKAFGNTEPDALQELTIFSMYINLFLHISPN